MSPPLYNIIGPVVPFVDDLLEGIAWTLCSKELSMTVQFVVLVQFVQSHSLLH